MFVAEINNVNGIDKVVLRDTSTGTYVEVLPSCGAILHSFNVIHAGENVNVIDGYESQQDFKSNVTAKGFKGCKLSPFACRINNARYHFGEHDYTIKKFLLGNNAIHGLIYDAAFSVTATHADANHASVSMSYTYEASDKGYPFYYDCLIKYTLAEDNLLTITTEVINKDEGLIPIQDGWHPYFTFGRSINDLQLEFQSKEVVEFDDSLIPTGELSRYELFGSLKLIGPASFDHCFTVNFAECQPLCVLRDPLKKMQLEIYPGNGYPYLQIYTPPHRNSIAIENLSAAPDAFNNAMGLAVLQPGEHKTFTTRYKITSLI